MKKPSKKQILIYAITLLAVATVSVTAFQLTKPDIISLKTEAAYGEGFSLKMSDEWKHPEQIGTNENPVGDYYLDDTYSKGECFVVLENYDLTRTSPPANDYDFSFKMAFPAGTTVLSNIDENNIMPLDIGDNKKVEFIKFVTDDFASYVWSSGNSNVLSLVRGFSTDKMAIMIHAGCTKESNIDPKTIINEFSLIQK